MSTHPNIANATTPRLVIPRESIGSIAPDIHTAHYIQSYAAITDYLNCTFQINQNQIPAFFQGLFNCLGEQFSPAIERKKGLHGWERSFSLGRSKALFGIGGQSGTGFLSLPGEACHVVPDWEDLTEWLRDSLHARITRWDGAVDDLKGIHSVDDAVALFINGKFNTGGNSPTCNQMGNWIRPDGSGRTFYIGKRQNGKMARIYEKGMQLGEKWHPWVRWEVELHNIDRVIPWDVLLEPGKYVAGSYPKALDWIQDEMLRIKTIRETSRISYDHLTYYAGVAYGKLIDVMMDIEGSESGVIEKLRRPGVPARLDLPNPSANEGGR